MTTMIGLEHDTRHACTDEVHLPSVYNPKSGLTACACGDLGWVGRVGSWQSRPIRASGHHAIIGWDRYFLHLTYCLDQRITPELHHVCGGRRGLSPYAGAVRGARKGTR